jgi:hypothetical protein
VPYLSSRTSVKKCKLVHSHYKFQAADMKQQKEVHRNEERDILENEERITEIKLKTETERY